LVTFWGRDIVCHSVKTVLGPGPAAGQIRDSKFSHENSGRTDSQCLVIWQGFVIHFVSVFFCPLFPLCTQISFSFPLPAVVHTSFTQASNIRRRMILLPVNFFLMLTCCQSVYMQEMAKSAHAAHLSASTAEQRSEAADRVGNPADEAQEDRSAIQMIGPSIRNRKGVL
jgi:hypothetical protein